ncbi:hypothetical protein D3C78_1936650 [compost metagenome]
MEAGKPVAVLFGRVSSLNPLEVIVDQRLPLTEDFLIILEQIGSKLALEDTVLLLRVQGGQRYVVWDRMVSL